MNLERVQNIAVDDDQDRNRLIVDIYFYVVGVPIHKLFKHFYKAQDNKCQIS